MRLHHLFALLAVALVASAARAQTTFTVTTTTDAAPTGLGVGSGASGDLRYCIHQANALSLSGQAVTINFGLPANSTITLGNNSLPPLNPGQNGQLGANPNSLVIDGSTATNLTIDGANVGKGIFMAYAGNITVRNLTLANGLARGGNGSMGGGGAGLGGGILVNNFATVTGQSLVFNNTRAAGGSSAHSVSNFSGGGGTNGGGGNLGNLTGGGGGGLGGFGGSEGGGGGGVGAFAGTFSSTAQAGQFTGGALGGSGTNPGSLGGAFGGGGAPGGGGGVGGTNATATRGGDGGFGGGGGGRGGNGGDYGGGGGGPGGIGGFGGGGGSPSGRGGFGGGGANGRSGGFGAGNGSGSSVTAGGGGLGAGGAAFVRAGGSLNLIDPVFSGTISAVGGTVSGAAGTDATPGQGIGQGLFLGGGTTLTVSNGNFLVLGGSDFVGGRGNQPASADPTNDAVGALTKAGLGILILTGSNSYAGGTTVSEGTLSVGHAQATGPGTVTVDGGATLSLSAAAQLGGLAGAGSVALNTFALTVGGNNASTTFSGPMTGTGSLTKVGTGTLVLSLANLYAGGTTVSGGTLRAANPSGSATGTGAVTVGNGGTLGGGNGGASFNDSTQGFMTGPVTVQSGGTIAPGASVGMLSTTGAVTFQAGSRFAVELGTTVPRPGPAPSDVNTNDRLRSAADILFGTSLTMPVDGGGQTFSPGTYDYFIGRDAGTVGGLPVGVTFVPTNFGNFVSPTDFALSRSADGLSIILTYTAVPEPGSLALLGVAVVAGLRLRRASGRQPDVSSPPATSG